MPAEFSTMSADNLQLLDKCGAVRSSLNSWAIATWAENSVVKNNGKFTINNGMC